MTNLTQPINPIGPYNQDQWDKHVSDPECSLTDEATLWFEDEHGQHVLFHVCGNCGVQTSGLFMVLDFANFEYVP